MSRTEESGVSAGIEAGRTLRDEQQVTLSIAVEVRAKIERRSVIAVSASAGHALIVD